MGSKDVMHMLLPAEIYQPISELQKRAEEVEYSELLDKVGIFALAGCTAG